VENDIIIQKRNYYEVNHPISFYTLMKKVLILCTGNSCRSIIAEALINAKCDGIIAESSGVKASGKVNPNAKKVLENKGIWNDVYHSKILDKVIDNDYDLIVTVCGHAQKTCPLFPNSIKTIHIGFEDPDGKNFEAFEATYNEIEKVLLPKVVEILQETKEPIVSNKGKSYE
jgi:arsenate reductase